MSIFGENSSAEQFNPDNPLGIKQAQEEVANPGQPQNDVATGTVGEESQQLDDGQANENLMDQQPREQVEEVEVESIELDDDIDKKVQFVRKKFKSADDFEQSVTELQRKLGKENEHVALNSEEEAINYYIQLEKELGQRSQVVDNPVNNQNNYNENFQLKQQVSNLQNMIYQLQNKQNPQPQQNQQPQQEGQETPETPELNFDDIDTNQFMKEFYEKGPNAESFKKVVMRAAEQISDKKLSELKQEQQKEQQTLQQKQQQAQQLKQVYEGQAEQLKQRYGEQEFEGNKQQMLQVFNEYPMYLNPTLFPNGFEIAYREAKKRSGGYQQQQNTIQQQQQKNVAQKMSATMPKSNSVQRFNTNKPSPEERAKQQIFQQGNKTGIFG